jgi:hypothetical protein
VECAQAHWQAVSSRLSAAAPLTHSHTRGCLGWERSALMERKLREGTTLIVDRYSFSGVAFTAAKEKPGLDLEWCKVRPSAHRPSRRAEPKVGVASARSLWLAQLDRSVDECH